MNTHLKEFMDAVERNEYDEDIKRFVAESNRIEGIFREPSEKEINATKWFLSLEKFTVDDIANYVSVVAGASLRDHPGDDVRVGNHVPPRGGQPIVTALWKFCEAICGYRDAEPWLDHIQYETLHPFMDGNGRSGRLIWAWSMIHILNNTAWLKIGFLHTYYYQTLADEKNRKRVTG